MRGKLACAVVLGMVLGCEAENYEEGYLFVTDGTLRERLPYISRSHIKELQIDNVSLRKEDLDTIGSFRNLELLRLNPREIEQDDFHQIAKLTKLKAIDITSSQFTDADLGRMAKLNELERISLWSDQVTDSGFAALTGLKSVRLLVLRCPLEDEAMRHIAQFPKLHLLDLTHACITDTGLMHLSKNYWLKNLIPPEQITTEGLRTFRKTLLEGRRKARAEGLDVPPDDELLIQVEDPEIRGGP